MDKKLLKKEYPEIFLSIRNEGVEIGKEHATPSPETSRRLKTIEHGTKDLPVTLARIEDKQDQTNAHLKELNHGQVRNTEHRLKTEGATNLLKFVGFTNIVVIVGALIYMFNK